jgi:hypothetical protein
VLAGHQLRQVFLFLRGSTPAAQLVDTEIRVRAVREADRRGSAADLFHCDDMREITQAGAPEIFLYGDPEEAEVAELRPQLAREAILPIDVGGKRRDAFRGKLRHGGAQGVDVFSESEVEVLHLKCSVRAGL